MKKQKPKFYEFTQNNSGGVWVTNDKVCHRLFIEADNSEEAIAKMLDLGAYFYGEGDCPCCGNRWSEYADELTFPYHYSEFSKEEAEKIQDEYEVKLGKSTFRFMNKEKPDPNRYDIIFPNPVVYAQFLKNRFSLCEKNNPDSRIYYKDGKVIEI